MMGVEVKTGVSTSFTRNRPLANPAESNSEFPIVHRIYLGVTANPGRSTVGRTWLPVPRGRLTTFRPQGALVVRS